MDLLKKPVRWNNNHGSSGEKRQQDALLKLRPQPRALGTGIGVVAVAVTLALVLGYLTGHAEVDPLQKEVANSQEKVRQLQGDNASMSQQAQTLQAQVQRLEGQVAGFQKQNAELTTELTSANKQLEDLRAQLASLTVCSDGRAQLAQVRDFLAKGQYTTAANLAEAALNQKTPRVCEPGVIAAIWYDSSLRAILTTPKPDFPNASLQEKVVSAWQQLEQQADNYPVPYDKRWDAMSVATVATNGGWWILADAAWQRAWKQGTVGPEAIPLRYSLLRNEGNELAFKGTPEMREQGVRLLATAQAINRAYNLRRGEACTDLNKLGYVDCNQPLPDTSDLLLAAARR